MTFASVCHEATRLWIKVVNSLSLAFSGTSTGDKSNAPLEGK